MAASIFKTLRTQRSFLSTLRRAPPASPPSASSSSQALPPHSSAAQAAAAVAAASASQSQEEERGKWAKALLFLPGAISFGLGTWQICRRQEKVEMLEYRRKRLEMEPLKWNELSSVDHDLDSLEFRKIICEGDFAEKSIYIGPRSRSISGVTKHGFYVITPFIPRKTVNGSMQLPLLVNRGWVPRDWKEKSLENARNSERCSSLEVLEEKKIEGTKWWKFWSKQPEVSKVEEHKTVPTKVIGVVRGSEEPSIFVPDNDPTTGQWFYVDVPMIARTFDLPENTPYIEDINEDISASNPYPLPKDVKTLINYSVMPQDHLNYTLTWYSLSAAVTYMALRRIRPMKLRR